MAATRGVPEGLHRDRGRPTRSRPGSREAAIARCIELSAMKYCPVSAMLSAGATIVHHRYRIVSTGATPYEVEGEVIATGPYARPDILADQRLVRSAVVDPLRREVGGVEAASARGSRCGSRDPAPTSAGSRAGTRGSSRSSPAGSGARRPPERAPRRAVVASERRMRSERGSARRYRAPARTAAGTRAPARPWGVPGSWRCGARSGRRSRSAVRTRR